MQSRPQGLQELKGGVLTHLGQGPGATPLCAAASQQDLALSFAPGGGVGCQLQVGLLVTRETSVWARPSPHL